MTKLDTAFLERFTDTIGPVGKSLGMLIDQMFLQERLDYNQLTGVLTWRYRPSSDFPDRRAMKIWNACYAGKRAGGLAVDLGYRTLSLSGHKMLEHRAIFCIMEGYWPERIDHENHVRDDNRWANLAEVTHAQNNRNRLPTTRNRSGVTGVSWNAKRQQWYAYIGDGGRTVSLGMHDTLEAATAARAAAELERGFHPNHGKVLQ